MTPIEREHKRLQDELISLVQENGVLLEKRLSVVKEQLEMATFLNDSAQVQALREQYHAIVDRRLDVFQSCMKLTQQMMDLAQRS